MIVKEQMQQGSEEWFAVRRGRPTASNFKRIITPKTGELSASRIAYIDELIAECFFPDHVEFEGNRWTDRGNELEPIARDSFEAITGADVAEVGFCVRSDELVGCSPDGLIRDADGEYIAGLEIKCPTPKTHVKYVRKGELPDEYKTQVHGGMAVTGLDTWHFFSFAPGVQPLWLIVERDDYTEKLSQALDSFIIEYADTRNDLMDRLQLPTATESE